jgi:hypothetical protein
VQNDRFAPFRLENGWQRKKKEKIFFLFFFHARPNGKTIGSTRTNVALPTTQR